MTREPFKNGIYTQEELDELGLEDTGTDLAGYLIFKGKGNRGFLFDTTGDGRFRLHLKYSARVE